VIPGYFIAKDGAGDVWIWAENGGYPLPVMPRRAFSGSDARPLWDALASQLEVRTR
jgi:hypothetical protein